MKRHLPFAAMLVLAIASMAFAQEPTPSPTPKPRAPRVTNAQLQAQLVEKETALWNAWKNKDPKPFETHLSDDSVLVGDAGVSGKKNAVFSVNVAPCEIRSFTLSDWELTKFSTTSALITYKGTQDGTCGGTALPSTVWASSLWVRKKGTWMAAFHQETPAR